MRLPPPFHLPPEHNLSIRISILRNEVSTTGSEHGVKGREVPIVERTKRKYLLRLLSSLANDKEWYRILIESVMSNWVLLCLFVS
jgi:hypothetical protein